jgi:lysophospholipase L1-like esterase
MRLAALFLRARPLAALVLLSCAAIAQQAAPPDFHLKDGDRVVFYGDSITDQRLYTTFVETYALTRFPSRKIAFVHSGWGGDKVYGGAGGPVELRLQRDVFAYKPTVVTVMLGMNDGRYRGYTPNIYNDYIEGLEALIGKLKAGAPGVRITAIRPSPYDEVTRALMAGGGYNNVLVMFGQWVQEYARRDRIHVADLNAPVVAMLERAQRTDSANAEKIIPDRVHPGPAGHLIMAAALLQSWNAPSRVSLVELDAAGAVKQASRTKVTGVNASGGLQWTQMDESLPMPVDLDDPVMKLAVDSSGFTMSLNQQNLTVRGLSEGYYALRIDSQQVAVFTAAQLGRGINLATYPTPMTKQAAEVHVLTLKHNNVHNARWRTLQVPLDNDKPARMAAALAALDALEEELVAQQRAKAQPLARKYELLPVSKEASSVPAGFTPIFNGKDTTGWHISTTNHHGQTKAWTVAGGVLSGMQDKPGHGGILLTDKKYKNFEIYLEIQPDFGCDGGLFLRSTEAGAAYQVMLDYLEGGAVGGIYGERLPGVVAPRVDWRGSWIEGKESWNSIRARIEGDVTPRIRVWMNGKQITDWSDTRARLLEGHIAVQVHAGSRWIEGGKHRFRNIAVRELP